MNKLTFPILVFLMFLMACDERNDTEDIGVLDNGLLSAIEELEEISEEEVVEEVETGEVFHSVDGKFRIKFMGEPTKRHDAIPTEVGNIEMTSYLYEQSVTEAYMVAYSDYPSELVAQSSVDDILVGARDGSSGNLGIRSYDLDEKVEINGNPGLYFKGKAGSIHAEYKLYLVGNRLYQLAILRDGDYSKSERSSEFFDSFQLVEK